MRGGLMPDELQSFFRRRGISLEIAALLMILFGILVIVLQEFIAVLVGLYLIIAGVVTLLGHLSGPKPGAQDREPPEAP